MAAKMGDKPKLVLLTGGNSGIGLEACKILCARGYTVVATVRSNEKGEDMIKEVKAVTPDADINYMLCEMSDPRSIRALAEEFKAKWLSDGRELDILVNNAGALLHYEERQVAEVNPEWEKTVVTNALAPIYLTDLLLDNLKQTAEAKGEARVVMVNSSITTSFKWYNNDQTDMDDIMLAKPGAYTDGNKTYKNSKLILMMATLALVEEMKDTNVKINSMCPGVIPGTNAQYANISASKLQGMKRMMRVAGFFFGKSNSDGGQYLVDVADGKRGATHGLFYVRGKITTPNSQVLIKENQMKIRQLFQEMTNSV